MAKNSIGADFTDIPNSVMKDVKPVIEEAKNAPVEPEGPKTETTDQIKPVFHVNTDGSVSVTLP